MLKYLYLLTQVLFWGLFVQGVSAQDPLPPPAPLIYESPKPSDIKEFSDPDKGFKISFPGTPSKVVELLEHVSSVTYKVRSKGSNASVCMVTFSGDVEQNAAALIDTYRRDLASLTQQGPANLRNGTSNILIDTEIKLDGHPGREFGYESDFHYTRIAIFVVKNRMYEIKVDVTNWHLLKAHHPDRVRAFNNEADRFIKSFSLVK
jgi:hypothetical protein